MRVFPRGCPPSTVPQAAASQVPLGHAARAAFSVIPVRDRGQQRSIVEAPGSVGGAPDPGVPFASEPLPLRRALALHERFPPDAADDPRAIAEAAAIVQAAVQSLVDRGLEMREGVFA
jgi:hypothetical protein